MTIRDLLSLNEGCLGDYITIEKQGKTILVLIEVSELHPVWLDYEVKNYYLLPHKRGIRLSNISCDYLITIDGTRIFQDKTTNIDKELNKRFGERNIDNESTNND